MLSGSPLGETAITPKHEPRGARLPEARGPVTSALLARLRDEPGGVGPVPDPTGDPLGDDDHHLALYVLYELHYRGFSGVDPVWEWEPSLLDLRRRLEQPFAAALRRQVGRLPVGDVEAALFALVDGEDDAPSLSSFLESDGTLDQLREDVVHRSAYQRKEADPHTFAIPRLWGEPKAALVTIQADEYGDGELDQIHAELFGRTMRELGLDDTYGAYLDHIPGRVLATVNLVSMFGLHRRLRGALIGHLALFEMSSVSTMASYSAALRRLGFGPWARLFYDTHVVADAEHQYIAARDLAGSFARQQPELAADVLFGAHALMLLEARHTEATLAAWREDRTSLRVPLPPAPLERAV